MRIHSLEIEGFGPFKDKQVIPFDKLSEDRLFMLEGPTGSGKSSIIDAIVFGLYGKTAHVAAAKAGKGKATESDTAANRRIRSDFCGFDDKTEVCIEFSNSQGRFRVRRIPPLLKLKKDGTTTESNAKLTLEFLNPPAQPINSVEAGNLRIKEIIGLEVEQFTQLIVLPQGKFASFFQATRDAREKIMKDIFKTFFYENLVAEIALRKKSLERRLQEHKNSISGQCSLLETIGAANDSIDWAALKTVLLNDSEPRESKENQVNQVVSKLTVDTDAFKLQLKEAVNSQDPLISEREFLIQELSKIKAFEDLNAKLQKLDLKRPQIEEKTALLKKIESLKPLQDSVTALEVSEGELSAANKKIPKKFAEAEIQELSNRMKSNRQEIESLAKEIGALSQLAEQKGTLEEKIELAEEILGAKKSLEEFKDALPGLEEKFKKAEKALSEYRINQTAAGATTLAKALKSGKPCPVCGSTEHPKKAKGPEYDEAKEKLLEKKVQEAREEVSDCKSEIKFYAQIAKRKSLPLVNLQKKLQDLEAKEGELEKKSKRQGILRTETKEIEDAIEAIRVRDSLAKDVTKLLGQINPKLEKYGIKDIKELKTFFQVNPEQISGEIDQYKEEVSTTRGLISQYRNLPEKTSLEDRKREVESTLEQLKQTVDALGKRVGKADSDNENLEKAKTNINTALNNLDKDRKDGEQLFELYKVVDGDLDVNKLGMSLERYVLQEKLELVLERGSELLYQISGGKYEFKVQEERVKGQKGGEGLGITVLDLHTGKERPAETVSGGESFYASLALALGLAEVIRAERGGLELGTLFIDEGFGSLDEDKLDEVFEVIENLSSESRIIGVISHVESMKQRIPARLEIRSTPGGPSTTKPVGVMI